MEIIDKTGSTNLPKYAVLLRALVHAGLALKRIYFKGNKAASMTHI